MLTDGNFRLKRCHWEIELAQMYALRMKAAWIRNDESCIIVHKTLLPIVIKLCVFSSPYISMNNRIHENPTSWLRQQTIDERLHGTVRWGYPYGIDHTTSRLCRFLHKTLNYCLDLCLWY